MTDPIKVALDEATWALRRAISDSRCGPKEGAAATIAAFLRTLHPHHAAQGIMGPDLAEIAAAVEQAAREGGG